MQSLFQQAATKVGRLGDPSLPILIDRRCRASRKKGERPSRPFVTVAWKPHHYGTPKSHVGHASRLPSKNPPALGRKNQTPPPSHPSSSLPKTPSRAPRTFGAPSFQMVGSARRSGPKPQARLRLVDLLVGEKRRLPPARQSFQVRCVFYKAGPTPCASRLRRGKPPQKSNTAAAPSLQQFPQKTLPRPSQAGKPPPRRPVTSSTSQSRVPSPHPAHAATAPVDPRGPRLRLRQKKPPSSKIPPPSPPQPAIKPRSKSRYKIAAAPPLPITVHWIRSFPVDFPSRLPPRGLRQSTSHLPLRAVRLSELEARAARLGFQKASATPPRHHL